MFTVALISSAMAYAQGQADSMKKQADESLKKKEYITARYHYLNACRAYAAQGNCEEAVECGVKAGALYHREHYYKEAFEVLWEAELAVKKGEQEAGKPLPALRYPIIKERMRIYLGTNRPNNAKELLSQLENLAKEAENDSLDTDVCYARANYLYRTGQEEQGNAAVTQLIEESNRRKAAEAQSIYNELKLKYDDSLQTIAEKDDSLATRQYLMAGLCVLAILLAGALVAVVLVLLRFMLLTRKQKKTITIANEHNRLKTQFIQNITAQMEPTLNAMDSSLPEVKALHGFTAHIQELSELENTLSEPYDTQEQNIATFCEKIMEGIRHKTQPDVTLTVNAPKLGVRINAEQLERVLTHLLQNAAEHTPAGGSIRLDFKKRGARTYQFMVADTGCGIAEERRANLFRPFSEIKDLAEGDGLGLPICSLIATKMNGSLTLDDTYTRGARFVLELHV